RPLDPRGAARGLRPRRAPRAHGDVSAAAARGDRPAGAAEPPAGGGDVTGPRAAGTPVHTRGPGRSGPRQEAASRASSTSVGHRRTQGRTQRNTSAHAPIWVLAPGMTAIRRERAGGNGDRGPLALRRRHPKGKRRPRRVALRTCCAVLATCAADSTQVFRDASPPAASAAPESPFRTLRTPRPSSPPSLLSPLPPNSSATTATMMTICQTPTLMSEESVAEEGAVLVRLPRGRPGSFQVAPPRGTCGEVAGPVDFCADRRP